MTYFPGPFPGGILITIAVLAFITGLLILRRGFNYSLNILMSLAFGLFSISNFLEGIIYVLQITEAFWYNLLRDLSLIAISLSAWVFSLAALSIKHSSFYLYQRKMIYYTILVLFCSLYGLLNDKGEYSTKFNTLVFYASDVGIFFIYICPLAYLVIAINVFLRLWNNKELDSQMRHKVLMLLIGTILILLTGSYFAIYGIIITPDQSISTIIWIGGHLGYLSAMVFFIIAFTKKAEKNVPITEN